VITANSPRSISILQEAFSLLLKHPALFLPKILIAVLYGFGILLSTELMKQMLSLYTLPKEQIAFSDLQNWFFLAIGLLLLTIISYFVDLFFSALYPIFVNHALKGKISFLKSINESKPKLVQVFVAGIILWLLITIFSVLETGVILFFNLSTLGFAISMLVTFAFVFVFYFLFPIIVSKKQGVLNNFKETFSSSFSNKKKVFLFSLIPFSVSLIKYGVAFFSDSTSGFILFWGLVLLTGIVYSVHAVVNQLLYLKLQKTKKD
jgi:uncharacterized membrane protein